MVVLKLDFSISPLAYFWSCIKSQQDIFLPFVPSSKVFGAINTGCLSNHYHVYLCQHQRLLQSINNFLDFSKVFQTQKLKIGTESKYSFFLINLFFDAVLAANEHLFQQ